MDIKKIWEDHPLRILVGIAIASCTLGSGLTMFLYGSKYFLLKNDHDKEYILRSNIDENYIKKSEEEKTKTELLAVKNEITVLKKLNDELNHNLENSQTEQVNAKKNYFNDMQVKEKIISELDAQIKHANSACDKERADRIKECLDRNSPEKFARKNVYFRLCN